MTGSSFALGMGGCSAGGATIRRWRRASSILSAALRVAGGAYPRRSRCRSTWRRRWRGLRRRARRRRRAHGWRCLSAARRRRRSAAPVRRRRRRRVGHDRRRQLCSDRRAGVRLRRHPRSASAVSPTQIVCVAPPAADGAQAVDLRVSRGGGSGRQRLELLRQRPTRGLAAVAPAILSRQWRRALSLTASNLLPTIPSAPLAAWIRRRAARRRPDGRHRLVSASARCAAPRTASPLPTTVRLEQPRADGAVAHRRCRCRFWAPPLDAGTARAATISDAAAPSDRSRLLRARWRRQPPLPLPPPPPGALPAARAPAAAAAAAILAVHTSSTPCRANDRRRHPRRRLVRTCDPLHPAALGVVGIVESGDPSWSGALGSYTVDVSVDGGRSFSDGTAMVVLTSSAPPDVSGVAPAVLPLGSGEAALVVGCQLRPPPAALRLPLPGGWPDGAPRRRSHGAVGDARDVRGAAARHPLRVQGRARRRCMPTGRTRGHGGGDGASATLVVYDATAAPVLAAVTPAAGGLTDDVAHAAQHQLRRSRPHVRNRRRARARHVRRPRARASRRRARGEERLGLLSADGAAPSATGSASRTTTSRIRRGRRHAAVELRLDGQCALTLQGANLAPTASLASGSRCPRGAPPGPAAPSPPPPLSTPARPLPRPGVAHTRTRRCSL